MYLSSLFYFLTKTRVSHEIPSVSSTVALGCVELFFNQVTTGGGDPVTLQAKETIVISVL